MTERTEVREYIDALEAMTYDELILQLAGTGMPCLADPISKSSDDTEVRKIAESLKNLNLLQDKKPPTFRDLDTWSENEKEQLICANTEVLSLFLVGAMEYAHHPTIREERTLSEGLHNYFTQRQIILNLSK